MVKRLQLAFLFLILSFANQSKANSSLIIDQDFNVISVNGQSHKSSFLTTDAKLKLRSGLNKIAIEYEVVFDQDDEFDLIKSNTLLISFYAHKNKNYTLNYLKPSNSRAARLFAKNPVLNIFDQNGTRLRASSYFLDSKSEGFVNQQTRPSLTGQPPIIITSEKTGSTAKDNSIGSKLSKNPVERLEYWWSQATPKQRQSFLEKISNN